MADYIEGRRAVEEALKAGVPIRKVFVQAPAKQAEEEAQDSRTGGKQAKRGQQQARRGREKQGAPSGADAALERVCAKLRRANVPIEVVEKAKLDRMSADGGSHGAHQGIMCEVPPYRYADIMDIAYAGAKKRDSLVLVLDHITDEGNLGAIIRTAEVMGADGVVIPSKRAAQVTVGVYKTSAGAAFHVPIARVPNLVGALKTLKDGGFWVAGASEHAHADIWHAPSCAATRPRASRVSWGSSATSLSRFPSAARSSRSTSPRPPRRCATSGSAESWVARSARPRPPSSLRGRAANVRKSLLLVDGYNVIRSQGPYRGLVDDDLRDPVLHDVYVRARAALIADVAAFAQGSYTRTTVVFDGFGNPDPERPPRRSAGIDIVFSPSGVEADTVIEQLARTYRVQGWEVTVITSDAGVQSTVFADGVTRLSSRMFTNEAHDMNERIDQMRYVPNTGVPARTTVKDRLPSDVRARLMQMAMTRQSKGASHGRK